MAVWTVTTVEKKSVEEHELWQKGDMVIRRISGFRWGTWTVTTTDDNPPEFDQSEGPGGDAVNMYDYIDDNVENIETEMLDDGWYGDIIWPDDMDDDERDRLTELWDEDGYDAWENEGWDQYDTECWASGPLNIERAE